MLKCQPLNCASVHCKLWEREPGAEWEMVNRPPETYLASVKELLNSSETGQAQVKVCSSDIKSSLNNSSHRSHWKRLSYWATLSSGPSQFCWIQFWVSYRTHNVVVYQCRRCCCLFPGGMLKVTSIKRQLLLGKCGGKIILNMKRCLSCSLPLFGSLRGLGVLHTWHALCEEALSVSRLS